VTPRRPRSLAPAPRVAAPPLISVSARPGVEMGEAAKSRSAALLPGACCGLGARPLYFPRNRVGSLAKFAAMRRSLH
jgi:hypothetical protein